ncbi:MAG: Asp-tRNA(Asn)/Glu-tRNA(Gln) amidotransferase subunit GatC [Elusimicrobiota bacterium]|nr:Asp-tRNA(Asn)/Glu-tRNA(Gln) amidotransferase subunit GatC [Elusimicrobiota bacterium]
MEITKKEIDHIAELAKLQLTDKEKQTYGSQLKDILTMMEQLNKADISKAEPASYSLGEENILREDEVEKFVDTESLLKNVPDRNFDFIKVKKAIT